MAGHSQFKNIMHRKGRQDAIRSKLFSKLAKEIAVAARIGDPDPASNPRLRLAIQNARAQSMPKENVQRAINRGRGGDAETYEEIRYEGYGPGGVAIIVEALTDNRNRTASSVRAAFAKSGGALGETGSVAFLFERVGRIIYPADVADADKVLEEALDAGADDLRRDDQDAYLIICDFKDIGAVSSKLDEVFGPAGDVGVVWVPRSLTPVDEDDVQKLMKLLSTLEDDDDVQNVHANFEIDDSFLARLADV